MADEGPKEGIKTENKGGGQDGPLAQFKIKRHTPRSKLMKAYCKQQGLSVRQLEMEDEDTIDVYQQQTGGVY
ncbi:PREDICTED: small ubiquitin-related modifier 2-like isoform X2 [Chinchilla lanigera]|uniref:small ubiquitin-related modifier 2-like isoform X2 n=1 Tax=Chinchilla lanigera TaxID=34839 RepID=UPI00038EDBCD|nr:PREDICTED: small ubiquitin-related modifier 2-like isoform X2 [Chinchilla lanigera]